jgi:branched-chain amino acid transport system substrate-binding protein
MKSTEYARRAALSVLGAAAVALPIATLVPGLAEAAVPIGFGVIYDFTGPFAAG